MSRGGVADTGTTFRYGASDRSRDFDGSHGTATRSHGSACRSRYSSPALHITPAGDAAPVAGYLSRRIRAICPAAGTKSLCRFTDVTENDSVKLQNFGMPKS